MKKLILLVVALLSVGCATVPSESEILASAGPSVSILLGDSGGGTGFQLSHNGKRYTVTNSHVCALADAHGYMTAQLNDGQLRRLKVIKDSDITDLCLLEPLNELPALILSRDSIIRPLSKYYKVGHAQLRPLNVTSGFVIDRNFVSVSTDELPENCNKVKNKMIKVPLIFGIVIEVCVEVVDSYGSNIVVLPGDSGSPILDSAGTVVGVAFASDNMAHWGLFVPQEHLIKLLEQADTL